MAEAVAINMTPFANESEEDNTSEVLEEVPNGKKLCPLCNSTVRLFFINFEDKLLMCENTECDFPFGYEELQLVRAIADEPTEEPEPVAETNSCNEEDDKLEERILSGKERLNKDIHEKLAATEKTIKSITELYIENHLEETKPVKRWEGRNTAQKKSVSGEVKINIDHGCGNAMSCINIEIHGSSKGPVIIESLENQIEFTSSPI